MMQQSGADGGVCSVQTPPEAEEGRRSPRNPAGAISRMVPYSRAPRAAASREAAGGTSGCASHHALPALACASVALDAGDRSHPEKRSGGGGKSAVSGTSAYQLCCGSPGDGSSALPGGGPGGPSAGSSAARAAGGGGAWDWDGGGPGGGA